MKSRHPLCYEIFKDDRLTIGGGVKERREVLIELNKPGRRVFYLDRLCRELVRCGVFPRLKVWTMKQILIASKEDHPETSRDFGHLGLLDITYGESHPNDARDIVDQYVDFKWISSDTISLLTSMLLRWRSSYGCGQSLPCLLQREVPSFARGTESVSATQSSLMRFMEDEGSQVLTVVSELHSEGDVGGSTEFGFSHVEPIMVRVCVVCKALSICEFVFAVTDSLATNSYQH